jgi:hypothetical protein
MSTLNFNIDDYYVPGTDRFSQWRTKYNSLLTTVGGITSTVNTELFGSDGTGVIAEMQSDISTINAELFGTSGSESGVIATLRSDVEYLTNRITTLNAQVNDANLAVLNYGNLVEQANQQIASLSASLSAALAINSKIVVALLANGIDINDPQATPAPTEAPTNTDLTGSWLSKDKASIFTPTPSAFAFYTIFLLIQ